MTEYCRDRDRDDYDLYRRCEAAVWFELVDRHIQQGCDPADYDVRKAENQSIYHRWAEHASRGILQSGMTYH